MRWVYLAVLTGCYTPAPPEGAPCGDGLRPCPTGQTCQPDNRCYSDRQSGLDGPSLDGQGGDGSTASTCIPRRLLTGTMPVEAQGWSIERVGAGSVTYDGGMITLSTTGGARQLLVLRGAFPPDRWSLRIVGEVVQSGGCAPANAAVAVMAGFHDPSGDTEDRARMLCIGESSAAWGDGSSSIGAQLGTIGTVTLERTASGGIKATVQSAAGQGSLTANGFTSNGTIAIGDQSTEAGLDSTIRIASVDLMCP